MNAWLMELYSSMRKKTVLRRVSFKKKFSGLNWIRHFLNYSRLNLWKYLMPMNFSFYEMKIKKKGKIKHSLD